MRTFWKSSYTGKEKSVDTGLGADATEQACENKGIDGTFVFVSGDRDYIFTIEDKILKRDFKVEIYAWSESLSKDYQRLQKKYPEQVKLFAIDDFALEVCFFNYKQKDRIPRDRTIVINYEQLNLPCKKDAAASEMVKAVTEKFHVPFLYQWNNNTLFLSAIPAEQKRGQPTTKGKVARYSRRSFLLNILEDFENLKELYDIEDEEFLNDVATANYDFTVLYNQNKKHLMEKAKQFGDFKIENFTTAVEWFGKKMEAGNSDISNNKITGISIFTLGCKLNPL